MLKIELDGEIIRKFSYDNFSIFENISLSIGLMVFCSPFYPGLFAGVEFSADKNPIVNTGVTMLNSTFFQIIFVLLSAGLFIHIIILSIKSIGMEEAFIELSNDTISIPKVDVIARSISITTLKYTEILSLKEVITESKNTVTGSKMGTSTELKLATKNKTFELPRSSFKSDSEYELFKKWITSFTNLKIYSSVVDSITQREIHRNN